MFCATGANCESYGNELAKLETLEARICKKRQVLRQGWADGPTKNKNSINESIQQATSERNEPCMAEGCQTQIDTLTTLRTYLETK